MIVMRNLCKVFRAGNQRKVVADNINAVFPSGVAIALLGRNGAGKSTLLQMIAGNTSPTSGQILSDGNISFPVGLANSVNANMTGSQNTRFVARVYGVDTDDLVDFVRDFAELGPHFEMPVRTYSSGMRSRLIFGINMGIEFDTYLIDEVTATGDASFKKKSTDVFRSRLEKAGAIFVNHSPGASRDICTAGALLEDGKLTYFDDIEEALEVHEENMRRD